LSTSRHWELSISRLNSANAESTCCCDASADSRSSHLSSTRKTVSFTEDDCAFYNVLQFANIPGPTVAFQLLRRVLSNVADISAAPWRTAGRSNPRAMEYPDQGQSRLSPRILGAISRAVSGVSGLVGFTMPALTVVVPSAILHKFGHSRLRKKASLRVTFLLRAGDDATTRSGENIAPVQSAFGRLLCAST